MHQANPVEPIHEPPPPVLLVKSGGAAALPNGAPASEFAPELGLEVRAWDDRKSIRRGCSMCWSGSPKPGGWRSSPT
jgi:glyoxylate/hydroxypyruvate reductase A